MFLFTSNIKMHIVFVVSVWFPLDFLNLSVTLTSCTFIHSNYLPFHLHVSYFLFIFQNRLWTSKVCNTYNKITELSFEMFWIFCSEYVVLYTHTCFQKYKLIYLTLWNLHLFENSHKRCRGFQQAMEARTTRFISFIKSLFSALTVNSHNSETVKPRCTCLFRAS